MGFTQKVGRVINNVPEKYQKSEWIKKIQPNIPQYYEYGYYDKLFRSNLNLQTNLNKKHTAKFHICQKLNSTITLQFNDFSLANEKFTITIYFTHYVQTILATMFKLF